MRTLPLSLLVMLFPLNVLASDAARLPPQPNCLDARTTTGVYQSDEQTLIVASRAGHYRLDLGSSCPALTQSSGLSLRGPGGWICGGPDDSVRAGDQQCPIAASTPIDSREYAQLARQASRYNPTSLESVQVTAKAGINRDDRYRRGFVGTADYCFDPAQMRSWNETPDGLVVQVSPRRNAGNSTYKVELSSSCPMLSSSPSVFFRSGMGLGVICGNAGDRVVAVRDTFVGESSPAMAYAGSRLVDSNGAGGNVGTVITGQCTIQAVYPIQS